MPAAAGIECQPKRLVLVEPRERVGCRYSGGCRGPPPPANTGAAVAARSSQSATADQGRQARGVRVYSAPIRGRVGLEAEALEGRADGPPRRGVLDSGRLRTRVAGFDVDPVDLVQPVARRGLEGIGIGQNADRRTEGRPGPCPWPRGSRADLPARTP